MKKVISILAVVAALGAFTTAQAAESCAAKEAALQKEIRIAQQYGNYYKVAGLKKALAEVKAHCSNASVLADAQKQVAKLEKKLAEKRKDIAEVQADLREIQADLNRARSELAGLK